MSSRLAQSARFSRNTSSYSYEDPSDNLRATFSPTINEKRRTSNVDHYYEPVYNRLYKNEPRFKQQANAEKRMMGEGVPETTPKSDKKKETKDKKSAKYQYKGIIRSYPNFRGGNPYIHNQNMWSPPAWQETKYDHRKTEDLIEFNRSHYPSEYDDNRATFKPRISVLNPEIFRPVDVAERENDEENNNNSDSYTDEEDEENNYINNNNNNENNSYSGSRSVSEDSIEL